MKKVVIFGNGEVAEVAWYYLVYDSQYEVAAFTVDAAYIKDNTFRGLPVVPFEQVENEYSPDDYEMLVMISYAKVNQLRAMKYAEAKKKGYRLISFVSSKASVWPDTVIGDNSFIMENNVIQPCAAIGSNVILWSGNHIGHHTTISDHCFIASHVVVSGSVDVGEYSFLGVNATIRDNIKIGKHNVIGAGSLILTDTSDFAVYPARATEVASVPSNRLRRI